MNTTTEYFLTDALGSVRQLTDASGQVTLTNAYEPYGVLAQSAGSAQTRYGFTGEFTDPSGMVYLRARYYMPSDGRFLTRDTWMGDDNSPLSLNRWLYVEGNPINYTDPTGQCPEGWVKNPNGTCSFSIFEFLPGGGFIFTVPEELTWLFCEDQTSIFQQAYATPTVTPQPATSTPAPIQITSTPAPTSTSTPGYRTVLVYRGMNKTSPSDFRIDPPSGDDWLGGLSVFEILYANYKYQLPFIITYKGEKVPYQTTGTVIGALKDGQIYIGGGIALYTPDHGNPAIGAEHWSVNFGGLSVNDLKRQLADFAKKYFNISSN
ncbi:MAG TPA: RHS repeat-associated core domain-containing protein [Anaerolineales bacterium]|nr:RHS repeat-associated core domain-containing protein [Anaerolineales bacterium]